jgi:hypothetical protein
MAFSRIALPAGVTKHATCQFHILLIRLFFSRSGHVRITQFVRFPDARPRDTRHRARR